MKKTASQIADRVLYKLAEITEEEIRKGLTGVPGREGITPEEVEAYSQAAGEESFRKAKPWKGAIGGGIVGALTGGMAGLYHAPDTGKLNWLKSVGLPAGIGGLLGGAGGYGLGRSFRKLQVDYDKDFAQTTGDIARTGKIPHDIPAYHLRGLPEVAAGSKYKLPQLQVSSPEDWDDPDAFSLEDMKAEKMRRAGMIADLEEKGFSPLAKTLRRRLDFEY